LELLFENIKQELAMMANQPSNIRVSFRAKSQFQKDDCYGGRELGCDNLSTLEAVASHSLLPRFQATIRCCTNTECKEQAVKDASHLVQISLAAL